MAARKATGPYTPPTAPTDIPKQNAPAIAVPVRTDPIRVAQNPDPQLEPATTTGLIAKDILVEGTRQMRLAAENRRAKIAARMEDLRADWQQHQETLTSLRQQGEAIVAEMNALAAEMDPIVGEHERLQQAIGHYDGILETLGGPR